MIEKRVKEAVEGAESVTKEFPQLDSIDSTLYTPTAWRWRLVLAITIVGWRLSFGAVGDPEAPVG